MAKFFGTIGYAEMIETSPGIHEERITEKQYYGDLTRISRRLEGSGELNDDINIANEISIVADAYANQHFHAMRYVELQGARWKISTVEVKPPRLLLTVGGLYNA
jgi:hypothetical protein